MPDQPSEAADPVTDVVAWVLSDEGQADIKRVMAEVRALIDELQAARMVSWKQRNTPFSLLGLD